MHSSRICTIRSLPYGGLCSGVSAQGVSVQGGLCPGGSLSGGVCVRENQFPVDRQTPVKILPCLKFRLQTVTIGYEAGAIDRTQTSEYEDICLFSQSKHGILGNEDSCKTACHVQLFKNINS